MPRAMKVFIHFDHNSLNISVKTLRIAKNHCVARCEDGFKSIEAFAWDENGKTLTNAETHQV